MAKRANQEQIDKLYKQINNIRNKIALCDSDDEAAMYAEEVKGLLEQVRKLKRSGAEPKVVAVKDAHTVGEKIERRLKRGRRNRSAYHGNRVKHRWI